VFYLYVAELPICNVSAVDYEEMSALILTAFLFALQTAPDDDIVPIGHGVEPPKLTYKIDPHYTRTAIDAGVQGTVLLEIVVNERGQAQNIVLLSPLGFGLDERAEDCVSQWRFKPAMKDGKAVKTRAQVQVNFRLLGESFDSKAEMRRMQFNAILSKLDRRKEEKPSEHEVAIMRDLAKHKFAPADYVLGLWELEGDGLPKDPAAGLSKIQYAADKNYGPALFFIGSSTMEGRLFPKDANKGLALLRDAAVLGSKQAQFILGEKYEQGDGVELDLERAKKYFRLCAAEGTPECQFRLGKLLLSAPQQGDVVWLQAIAWLQLAEGHGLAAAKTLVDTESVRLTAQQAQAVTRLRSQLEHAPGR
jgi:TonB family protein